MCTAQFSCAQLLKQTEWASCHWLMSRNLESNTVKGFAGVPWALQAAKTKKICLTSSFSSLCCLRCWSWPLRSLLYTFLQKWYDVNNSLQPIYSRYRPHALFADLTSLDGKTKTKKLKHFFLIGFCLTTYQVWMSVSVRERKYTSWCMVEDFDTSANLNKCWDDSKLSAANANRNLFLSAGVHFRKRFM